MHTRPTSLFAAVLAGILSLPATASAHQSYNLAGYGSGLAGSINGADGEPGAGSGSAWTNGAVAAYSGALPVMWYAGMHDTSTARTIVTGAAPAPPIGSLLAQVEAYNAATDPDLPSDRVLAVGGKSWSDPDNQGQGWGHGLDYGLIEFEPVSELLAGGPVRFTVTVSDDPDDSVTMQLAFALYGGWDASDTSTRHQTFVTSPVPQNDPLGASGMTLLGYAVATAPGEPASRTFTLTADSSGRYTLLIGALGGVSGRYRVDIVPQADSDDLAQCQAELSAAVTARQVAETALEAAETALAAATTDSDNDGRRDAEDACPDTPAGLAVDQSGCSLAQFCASFAVGTRSGQKACAKADWRNDEPLMRRGEVDCRFNKKARRCEPAS